MKRGMDFRLYLGGSEFVCIVILKLPKIRAFSGLVMEIVRRGVEYHRLRGSVIDF